MYFLRSDYVGFWQRLFIGLVDVVAATVAWVVVAGVILVLVLPGELSDPEIETIFAMTLFPTWFAYFVLLKRFGRSLGYWLGRAKIVTLSGHSPSTWALFLRFLFAVLGPLNLLIDFVWIPSDDNRQALRDKFARTYVVRYEAQPAGRGKLKWSYYSVPLGDFIFCEVERPD